MCSEVQVPKRDDMTPTKSAPIVSPARQFAPLDGTLCACGELCKGVCLTAHNENRESQCASACKRLSK